MAWRGGYWIRGSVTAAGAVVKGMKHRGGSNCIANALATLNISVLSPMNISGMVLR